MSSITRFTLNTNVVLTKDKNVLKGDHLVYNLETGQKRADSVKLAPEQAITGGQRVRALVRTGQ